MSTAALLAQLQRTIAAGDLILAEAERELTHQVHIPPRPMPAPASPRKAWACAGCGAPCKSSVCNYCKSPQ